MRTLCITLVIAATLGAAVATPAHAGSVLKANVQNPSTSCALSIPSTDTKVRPKASGFRNEGTTSQFVICGFDLPSNPGPGFSALGMYFASFDGAAHTFDCTAMGRFIDGPSGMYLTKSVTTHADGQSSELNIDDSNPSYYVYLPGQSITCTLPPGVAILTVQSVYTDNDSAP